MREHRVDVPVAPGLVTGARLRTPDNLPGGCPLVVHCPGWMSTKDAEHYRRYHEHLAAHGVASLVFDYRYTVPGNHQQVIDPADLVCDAVAVVDRLAGLDLPIDVGRIVLFGSGGVGAGVAIVAAAARPIVAAVAALSPIASGERWLRWMRRPYEYRDLLAEVNRDRLARARGEPTATIAPVGGISLPPPERAQSSFKREIASQVPSEVAVASVERILQFDVTASAAGLGSRPLLLIACRDDVAVPYEDATHLHTLAGESATLMTLEGTDSYQMHRNRWRDIATELVRFIRRVDAGTTADDHRSGANR